MYFAEKRTLDEIIPGLFLGCYLEARNKQLLQTSGITHILNAAEGLDNCFPADFTYRHVPMQDLDEQPLLPHLQDNNSFIDAALQQGGKVFVHCAAGISRSSASVIAYVMWKLGLKFKEALELTKRKHSQTSPNSGFVRQLREFEVILVRGIQRPQETGERFQCKYCSAFLFSADEVSSHSDTDLCQKYFITRPEWLDFWDLYESRSMLRCCKCRREIGEQCREGLTCLCGFTVKPGFRLDAEQ